MSISIIIPTYNGSKTLDKLLRSIAKQTKSIDEIIIIDSSSEDETVDIAKKYHCTTISIKSEDFDHGGTRTKALKYVKSDIVLFLTQDILMHEPNAIDEIISVFSDSKIAVAYGRQIPYDDATYFAKQLRYNNYPERSKIISLDDSEEYGFKTFFCSNAFAAYRVSSLMEINGFKDHLLFGEDACATAELLLLGYKKAYVSEAVVKHSHNYTLLEEFRRYFDIGVFHSTEKWLIKAFGTPTGEGVKYVKKEIKNLFKERKYILLIHSIIRNGIKFVAYRLGSSYSFLPKRLVRFFTMNEKWWIKRDKESEIQ